ncbi:energy transducer TonB [Dyella jiangningensis]|uniref:energy transducer TonB n=1 Tax=Dyella jiangningensis TaxID=1379159 RepID=UPI00240F3B69|nr:energy transducer TonB [Dyella jiangningensis]MDG2539683.1 energy transducer TonB [Dyella jiangningensis]
MSLVSSHRRHHGVVRHGLLIVIVFMLAAAAVIFWELKYRANTDEPSEQVVAATGPIVREGAGIDELLQHARQAMADQRLLAPAGNNAFELYLMVLRREPGNRAAQDALREIFPFAAHAAEQTIDEGNDGEAQRQIALLAKADPQNYTLTLLQSKLQAHQAAVAQEALQAQQQTKREAPSGGIAVASKATSSAPAPVAPAAPPAPAGPMATAARPSNSPVPAEQALAQLHVESTAVEAAPRQVAHARTTPIEAAGIVPPVLTRRVEPVYPAEARRTRRQGWVDVIFTVQPDGSVAGASVADADPRYVFDRAALAAVGRWQFTPGMQDGKVAASQVRQRIEFRL